MFEKKSNKGELLLSPVRIYYKVIKPVQCWYRIMKTIKLLETFPVNIRISCMIKVTFK